MTTHETESSPRERFRIPLWVGACVLLGVAAFFLWTEHRAHLLGALPYVLLALCPLMHFFMHRGHGGHGRHDQDRPADQQEHAGHVHGGTR